MVHAMNALRKRKSLILDTCDIFVKEPLLDWVKEAKTKLKKEGYEGESSERESKHLEELEQLAFLPRKKILVVKDKLNGVLPSKIMISELQDSKHKSKPYYKQLVTSIHGSEDSYRWTVSQENKKYLDVSE
jgi:DNA-dependent protein kinase catalytic subunit